MASRQERPPQMCCRHDAMDHYVPSSMLGPLLEADFALDRPVSLALSSSCPDEESGTREVGQWAHANEVSLLDSNPVPPLFLLTASMKTKTERGGAKVASSSPVFHICKTQRLLAGPLLAGPDQKAPSPRAADRQDRPLAQVDRSLSPHLIYTPNHELCRCS